MADLVFWLALGAIVIPLLVGGVRVYHDTVLDLDLRGALLWTIFWVLAALAFSAVLSAFRGAEAGSEFLVGYVAEKALAVDNVFIFVVVFAALRIPPKAQYHVLLLGLIGAIIMRSAAIAAGLAFLSRFAAMSYVGGALLVATGMAVIRQPALRDRAGNWAPFDWLERHINPVLIEDPHAFMVSDNGRRRPTRLLAALGVVLLADLIFAIDSLPAILSITSDRFIVLAANVFGIIGMKAIYTVLTHLVDRFAQVKVGLALVLVFVGAKLIVPGKLNAWVSLAIVAALLVATEGAAALAARRERR